MLNVGLESLNINFISISIPNLIVKENSSIEQVKEDIKQIQTKLKDFRKINISLDLSQFNVVSNADILEIFSLLKESKLNVIEVKSNNNFLEDQEKVFNNKLENLSAANQQDTLFSHPEIHLGHIRSGQQIYSKQDLVILGSISKGAEVISNGNIYIYGELKGRALAGIKSSKIHANIFCLKMEADLISISGFYQVSEELQKNILWNKAVHIYLKNDSLFLRAINF